MPFDGTEAKFVKPAVFSVPGLIAWLETQDPATGYIYVEPRRCLMGLYTVACGGTYDVERGEYLVDTCRLNALPFPDGLGVLDHVAIGVPRTLGAALTRARQLLATA